MKFKLLEGVVFLELDGKECALGASSEHTLSPFGGSIS